MSHSTYFVDHGPLCREHGYEKPCVFCERDKLKEKVDKLTAENTRLKKERDDAIFERNACHKCWDDFTAKICTVIPSMKNAPLFQQAETIVNLIAQLKRLVAKLTDIARSHTCNISNAPEECAACCDADDAIREGLEAGR